MVFLNRPLSQSPEDDLLLQVQGIVAEYERAKIMERSRRGKKHAAQSGSLNVMSGAPFGFFQDNVQSYSTVEPAIDLTASSFLGFSWEIAGAPSGTP